ncbi:hypothetical protein MJO28_011854 [Puccinia striiformis f. sp. tritici]|uniref:Nuclear pore complex protein Nup160 n=3 Tax=Puccinia striiformis TaxID=27350 RepID=A0A0L0W005_9BASI|nr:hypothetical protein Pst134EB_022294 [Puccinia striiformis f. sp. tritici]KAI7944326.1 hypothetical protein MJO28_011854 [Puccinia striiformis f. sp. tritici]KAI9627732.1 hypothetical protein KEM48_012061 [Puccinia striiformis f. sp. tritici PST-130]KNF04854.1 hypothetical protein PSTG_01908 [Puccinia striiformis f. sp. tritici PST-78]POW03412.1 hypothetical protein PSTT_11127 [Puccinia striiformis]
MESLKLSTSTASLDSLRPNYEEPIEYPIPTNNNSSNRVVPLSSTSASANTIQPIHASQSLSFFPPQPTTGFIRATVINNGVTLELRWISPTKSNATPLDLIGSHQPVHFHFDEKIIPNPFITLENDEEETGQDYLIILVLTENYTLFRLKFAYPRLFYSELFEEDWITEYEVEEILNRQVILSHGIDSNNLIISCSDSILTHLSWGKLVGINENYGWKTSNLSLNRSALWSFLPSSWSTPHTASSKTISSSAHEWVATPSSTISIASHLTAGANGEDAWLFTVSRDRRLKAWSLTTGLCLKELPLDLNNNTSIDQNQNSSSELDSLLPAAPRTLVRFIYSDEGDDPSYEGFLIVFNPSPLSPRFVTYGLALTGENQFRDLVLLEERRCEPNNNHSNQKIGSLRDFQISKVDLSINFTTSPSKQRPWGLWAVWDDEIGGEGILQYTILHETKNWQDTSNRGWTTIQPPDRKTPWNSSYFDELLANDPSSSVTEIFIDHLFRPGHFSFSDLEYGLATYENSLEEIDEQQLDNSIYETLEEKICSIVGSNVNLEISNLTGVPMIEGYHRKLRIEWLKFATMCTESRASSLWPIELAVDADRQQVFINGRRSITTPVLIDTARLLSQLVQSVHHGFKPKLLEENDSGIDHIHPLLSNLNNRINLVDLVGTIEVLISSLSHVDVIKPLEDELSQTARRPFKSSIIDVTEDLFNRRLEPFLVDDDSLIHVSDRINQIKDLELSLQTLWKILSSSELIRSSSSSSSGDELEGDAESISPTILSQMFITDYLINTIEKRYELIRNTIIFLIYVYGEEEQERFFQDFGMMISKYFISYQQISMARWIIRQNAKIPVELGLENEDKLVDKLIGLHVSSQSILANDDGNQDGGGLLVEANSATSLLSSLLLIKFKPEFNCKLKLPGSIIESSSQFLRDIGLLIHDTLNNNDYDNQQQLTITRFQTHPKIILLVHFFLVVQLPALAIDFLNLLIPDHQSSAIQFLYALGYLNSGLIEEAEIGFTKAASAIDDSKFEIDDQSGLRLILPTHAQKSLGSYYSYIVSLFEPIGADQAVAKFCQLAIDSSSVSTCPKPDDDSDDDDDEEEEVGWVQLSGTQISALWVKLFKALVNLALWDDAYQALISIPSLENQYDCLRTLVSHMCEANEVDRLLRFSWVGLQTEFEKTIAFRARNSDPLSVPNYFAILYAYHINRADYRSAAISMYQHGRKIGDIAIKGGAFQYLMTQQCQSYLAAINALSLVPEKHAWIPMSCPKTSPNNNLPYDTEELHPPTGSKEDGRGIRRRRRVTYYVPEEEFMGGTRDIEVLNLSDIRSEYTLVLSRLQLANELPQLSQPGSSRTSETYLDGSTLVPMFLNQGRVMEALEKATVLGTDVVPLFITLTQSCCRLTLEGSQGGNLFDSQWVNGDPLGADWDTDLVSKSWRLLQLHLHLKFPLPSNSNSNSESDRNPWRIREAILECILSTSRNVKVPRWLLDQFFTRKPHTLLAFFFKFDLLSDAFTVAIHIVDQYKKSTTKESILTADIKTRKKKINGHKEEEDGSIRSIPFTDLDQLLNLTSSDLHPSSSSDTDHHGQDGYDGLDAQALESLQNTLRAKLVDLFPVDRAQETIAR